MVTENYSLVWTKRSSNQMTAVYKYISEDSQKNALKVINDIVFTVEKATRNHEFYPPEKYKKNNNWSYRALENIIIELCIDFQKMLFEYLVYATPKWSPSNTKHHLSVFY